MKNAIARECVCEIVVLDKNEVENELEIIRKELADEVCSEDKGLKIYLDKGKICDNMLTYKDTSKNLSVSWLSPCSVRG